MATSNSTRIYTNLTDATENRLGSCFAAFHGGWTEMQRRGKAPVTLLDFKKMYQTQFILQDIESLLAAERLEFVDDTDNVIAFLERLTLEELFDPAIWPDLRVLCWVIPNGEILTTKGRFDGQRFTTGMVGRDSAGAPIPWYLKDVILAKLMSKRTPKIVRAERIIGVGRQQLRKVNFPGDAVFDPEITNFFKFNVEEGERLKRGLGQYAELPDRVRDALVPGIKALGNSGAFGIFAETNPVDLPTNEREWVDLLGDDKHCRVKLLHPEDPGRFFCPPLAGLITAGARLMLGLAHRLVIDRGGTVAFGDTDSLAPVATRDGRYVLIETTTGGYERKLVRLKSLSWKDVEEISAAFGSINPYDRTLIPGSILEIKDVNFYRGEQVELEALGISAKRYLLRRPDGSIADRKESILGMLLSPLDPAAGDDRRDTSARWIDEAWGAIEAYFRFGHANCLWLVRPAVRRLAVTSPKVMNNLKAFNRKRPKTEQIRPFNFFLTATAVGRDCDGKLLRRAVVAPFERDPEKWAGLSWIDKDTGEPMDFGRADAAGILWQLKTVGEFLKEYAGHVSPEWLDQEGRPCNSQTCGVLTRRSIRDGDRYLLTKESLTWGDDPEHAFQAPQPEIFQPGAPETSTHRSDYWKCVVLPAIRGSGPKAVADRLKLNVHTVKRWLAGKRRPAEISAIESEVAGLASDLGLFSDDEVAHQNDAAIIAAIPERVALCAFFNVFLTWVYVTQMGLRPFARAIGISHSTVTKWNSLERAPATVAEINAYLAKIAAYARRELRQMHRRIVTDSGPVGYRIVIIGYSGLIMGSQKPAMMTHQGALEVPIAIGLIAILLQGLVRIDP